MDGITPLSAMNTNFFGAEGPTQKVKANGSAFEYFYDNAMKMYDSTNTMQVQSEKAQLDYITGKNEDMISVLMAQEKASTALSFTVQVTGKVIEAYKEIMRMQM